ncbi:MAG: MMPL family transporter [Desulfuromonadales bacterium]|nr:MMPL family transporter [Desulfuromonadales bacterium]
MNKQHSSENMAAAKAPLLERILFGNRALILVLFVIFTAVMGIQASKLTMGASFEKMIPTYHEYIKNYFKHKDNLKGLGNVVWISVEAEEGDIFTKEYFENLRAAADEIFFIPGVDRAGFKSLWNPVVRWMEVTEQGFEGGAVIPQTYDGSPESLQQLRRNILRSGEVGRLVANNFKSSIILAPLLEKNPETGLPVDYRIISETLEEIRAKYDAQGVKLHITGFAKIVGDLIEGAKQVAVFFAMTALIVAFLLFLYTRCIKCTLVPVVCAIIAAVLQAGMIYTLGYGLDPYSMLVPFLVFAIGVSHAVQLINGIKHRAMMGDNKFDAARYSFRLLYAAALCALITDGIGFGILYVIKIGVLQELSVGAAIGFPLLIIAVLVAMPLLMSYVGVSQKSVELQKHEEEDKKHPVFQALTVFTTKRGAGILLTIVAIATVLGVGYRQNLQIGDLDKGAPELRPDSTYNLDNNFIVENYTATSDLFVVMVETELEQNANYAMLSSLALLEQQLDQVEGVQSTVSMIDRIKLLSAAFNEGNFKWSALPRSRATLDNLAIKVPENMTNKDGTLTMLWVYLDDHKATTLTRVVDTVEAFAAENNTDEFKFVLAAGPSGIEAATNIEIKRAQKQMLLLVYGVVALLVLLTFRSLRGTIAIMVPLALTSLLCEVLMTYMGIGVKVATLPVISIGVGIGVDYGVYIYSQMLAFRKQGMNLTDAYYNTLKTTGKAVVFTGITLAVSVCTWAFSPIKFQADMGLLLAFMFIWNMIGAVCVLPAIVSLLGTPKSVKQAVLMAQPGSSE